MWAEDDNKEAVRLIFANPWELNRLSCLVCFVLRLAHILLVVTVPPPPAIALHDILVEPTMCARLWCEDWS